VRAILRFSTLLALSISMIAFVTLTPLSQADLREELGLVALWTLDQETINKNNVDDVFGENSGTITGDPKIVPGFAGEALDFDGFTDLVRMTNDIFFPSVTMEAIIKPTLGTRNPIYDKYNYGIQLLDNNQVGVWIRADTEVGNQWPQTYTPFPTDGKWHHVVGVAKDKEFVKIYLDGELKGTASAPDPISIGYGASQKPTIAYTQHLDGIWYGGAIDEVAIYEGALSDADVKRLYSYSFAVEPTEKLAVTWGMIKSFSE
jgi:hypothetical protein